MDKAITQLTLSGKSSPQLKQETKGPSRRTKSPISPNRTDLGDALRLVELYGPDFIYPTATNSFFVWDNTRYAKDETFAINRIVQRYPRHLYIEALDLDPEKREAAIQYALKCESGHKMEAILRLARTNEKIAIKTDQLDTNPWLLNLQNGTFNLQTGLLQPHRREDLITRLVRITYDERATCPTWDLFINRVTDGDRELIDFLQRALGYSLTGLVIEQCLFFLYGTGHNGKSVFIEILLKLLGEYAISTPTETLMARDRSAASNDLARLEGCRLAVANETNQNQRLDEAKIKALTGGDTITARRLYEEFRDFSPTHKLWIRGNYKPVIRGVDTGIWRRMRLIPFTVHIPESERDPFLMDKLTAELPGILNWAIVGCLAWQGSGLGEPKAVINATAEYRAEMDILGTFIEDELVIDKRERVSAQLVFNRFTEWTRVNGEREMSKKKLGLLLAERGFKPQKSGSVRYWLGIKLVEHDTAQGHV